MTAFFIGYFGVVLAGFEIIRKDLQDCFVPRKDGWRASSLQRQSLKQSGKTINDFPNRRGNAAGRAGQNYFHLFGRFKMKPFEAVV